MASYLETALSEVVARIDQSVLVPHGCGKQKLDVREAMPRVVWTRGEGPAKIVAPLASTSQKRALCAEDIPVTIHIIAEDSDTAETILDVELVALFQVFGQHAVIGAQVGVDSNAETLKTYGYYTQLRVFVPRPVRFDPPTKFKVTGYQLNPATSIQDGWITVQV